jgi:hypothetical protein
MISRNKEVWKRIKFPISLSNRRSDIVHSRAKFNFYPH